MQVRFLEWIKNQLDVNSTMPLYRQLQQAIESAIEHKIVDAGDYLPAERYLAQQLNLSRVTISKAMQSLEKGSRCSAARGWYSSRKISRLFVIT